MVKPLFPSDPSDKHDLVEKLKNDVQSHFFDYALYDVNDALTSILALCDMDGMENVPKVKAHIQRVNELLENLRVYQASDVFNINHVLKNTVNLLRKHFKGRAQISASFSVKRALSSMDRHALEKMMIGVLVEMISEAISPSTLCKISIHLAQLGRNGQITLIRHDFPLNKKEINAIRQIAPSIEIRELGHHTEVIIGVPLCFMRETMSSAKAGFALPEVVTTKGVS